MSDPLPHDPPDPRTAPLREVLALSLTPGVGPVLIARLIAALGSPRAVLEAPAERLRTVKGIGRERVKALTAGKLDALARADAELALAERLGVRIVAIGSDAYPPLLAQIPDPPPVLYVRGALRPADADRYAVAIVGSRDCTPYGSEQAERFATALASAGLTIVSGGARGIDSAAHRAAARVGGRTIVVQGCGLVHTYPPENGQLFDAIVTAGGCIVSELPLNTPPTSDNFPARNRIISGLSLGVIVIEAARGSGALITARQAAEDQGREVFILPGRVDSPASEGSLQLIKDGGGLLITNPADVLEGLESPARHHHGGTHAARYSTPSSLFEAPAAIADSHTAPESVRLNGLTEQQQRVLSAIDEQSTLDDVIRRTGADPGALRADITVLELRRLVVRDGVRLRRAT